MHTVRNDMILFLSALGILAAGSCIYLLLQNRAVYNNLASPFLQNYYYENGSLKQGKVPYVSYSDTGMLHWDAFLYLQIRDNGYNTEAAGGDYIFAFFPLFPLVWKLSNLSPTGIALLNYLLFILSLIMLFRWLPVKIKGYATPVFLLCLCSPMLVVFLIPYSEGVFMFTATIALWAMYRKKRLLYFIAGLLMSVSRSSVTILLMALCCTELYFFLQHRNLKHAINSLFQHAMPLLIGMSAVSLIQLTWGSGSLFKFLEVQRYWGFQLGVPGRLRDWSHEQFGINLSVLILLIPLSLAYLLRNTMRSLFSPVSVTINPQIKESHKEYLFVLSMAYLNGMALAILLFRGGSLNGISRFVLCSPFFYIVLLTGSEKAFMVPVWIRRGMFLLFFAFAVYALSVIDYSKVWNFSDMGFLLLFFQLCFFISDGLFQKSWLVALYILLSLLWSTYLFNMFLTNAWIFT